MQQPLFQALDAAMIRVSTSDPREPAAALWPDGAARRDSAAWHGFIAKAWASDNLANAVALASPALASTISGILDGTVADRAKTARAAMALARYMVRLRGRATPFGLFSGVTLATTGGPSSAEWGTNDQTHPRADARWLAALVARLEASGPQRPRLRVTASDLTAARGERIIVGWLPHASTLSQDAPAEISLRRTPAAETALSLARTPITVGDLAAQIVARFPQAAPEDAEAMIAQLMTCGALISELRPPSTATDGLAWILDTLSTGDADDPPGTIQAGELRDLRLRLRRMVPADLDSVAVRMRSLAEGPAHPVAVDLRADCRVTIPEHVAAEAAAAASALARLSPYPHGTAGWKDYHARFLDRYGPGAAIPVADLLDPVTGLGLPAHYTAPAPASWSARDERLAALAQQAALDGATEVVLNDRCLDAITGPEPGEGTRPVPHMDITVDVRAASTQAVGDGAFTIAVRGTGRTAMASSGRFLHLLTDGERERLARLYRDLPTATRSAVMAQLSFPPHHPRAENVTRVPRMLPHLVSVGEHHGQDDPGRIPFDDLAVIAGPDRLHLISLSRRVPVEPVLASAPAWHAVPPVVRLLFDLPRASCPPVTVFDWGAAAHLPFLPRIRLGRSILAPARWRIPADSLPGPQASHDEWTTALRRLRERLRLPGWVSAGSGDRQLRLCLDEPMDRAVLRAHLDTGGEDAVVTESWEPDDHAWCGGRACEITVPLASAVSPGPPPKILARRGPFPAADPGHLPGAGSILSARLYSNPALFDLIVTRNLPVLTSEWDDLARWWFIRYRDPRHHLRLRLHAADSGQAAARLGRWAEELRRQGLVSDLALDTYRPETGRFGTGPALAAAETLFAADSAAAAAEITAHGLADPHALTAASLVDLSAALLGGRQAGIQWLTRHPVPAGPQRLDPAARRQALALTGTGSADTVPATVRRAWHARADAAEEYAGLLAEAGRDPASVLESLLHLHHNRVHGPGPAAEAVTYRLARACALRQTAAKARNP